MILCKIQDGAQSTAPKEIKINGCWHLCPSIDVLKQQGYKPLKAAERPIIEWYEKHVISYSESESEIIEVVDVAPLDNIWLTYENRLIDELNRALENDFIWDGKVVKFSESNQKDYLASFSVATYRPEMFIPMEYTFKNNVKHIMQTLDELVNFTNLGLQFISQQLEIFRSEKSKCEAMTNNELYNYLKTK